VKNCAAQHNSAASRPLAHIKPAVFYQKLYP
jgi:hypothetical protein